MSDMMNYLLAFESGDGGGSSGGGLIVNISAQAMDKTWSEIATAMSNGQVVFASYGEGFVYLVTAVEAGSGEYTVFVSEVAYKTNSESGYPAQAIS